MHHNQTGFIRGRFLKDNVKKVMDIVYRAQVEDPLRALIFLGAEKAFDIIEWQYMHYIVREFGVGVRFQTCLRLLYRDQLDIITYKGQSSSKINLSRRFRQGFSLSPLLFALALEPLAIIIHNNTDIVGYHDQKTESKISLYADDVVCFFKNPFMSMKELSSH